MNYEVFYEFWLTTKHELFQETFILELAPSKESLTIDALSSHDSAFDMTAEVKTLSSISNPAEAVQNFQVDIRVNGSLALSK